MDATQKSCSPGGEVVARPGAVRVVRVVPDVSHDGVLDAVQVLLDVGVPGDADEDVAIALAADADVAEDGPRGALEPPKSTSALSETMAYVAVEKSSLGDIRKPSSSR